MSKAENLKTVPFLLIQKNPINKNFLNKLTTQLDENDRYSYSLRELKSEYKLTLVDKYAALKLGACNTRNYKLLKELDEANLTISQCRQDYKDLLAENNKLKYDYKRCNKAGEKLNEENHLLTLQLKECDEKFEDLKVKNDRVVALNSKVYIELKKLKDNFFANLFFGKSIDN